MIEKIKIPENVGEMVKIMDKVTPGWAKKIDLNNFSLNGGTCILSQVYGVIFCSLETPPNCPFTIQGGFGCCSSSKYNHRKNYGNWRKAIRRRQNMLARKVGGTT